MVEKCLWSVLQRETSDYIGYLYSLESPIDQFDACPCTPVTHRTCLWDSIQTGQCLKFSRQAPRVRPGQVHVVRRDAKTLETATLMYRKQTNRALATFVFRKFIVRSRGNTTNDCFVIAASSCSENRPSHQELQEFVIRPEIVVQPWVYANIEVHSHTLKRIHTWYKGI